MTFIEIQNRALFQYGMDAEDIDDVLPALPDYANEGYDLLHHAWYEEHLTDEHPRMLLPADVPELPQWTHKGICDYATYMLYRNGNPQKQNRGQAFLLAFEEIRTRIRNEGGVHGKVRQFRNIPD